MALGDVVVAQDLGPRLPVDPMAEAELEEDRQLRELRRSRC